MPTIVWCIALVLCPTVATSSCGFRTFFEQNLEGPGIHKWEHYFSAYEQEFSRHCGPGAAPVKMIEIGIQSGGSMRMWRQCFGDALEALVGVDVNAETKAWERFGKEAGSRPNNVHVEIGSQADAAVFDQIDAKHPGGFDIVLDDGSHDADHMIASFSHAWRLLRPGGVYFIEDITKENVRALEDIVLSANHPYAGSVRAGHSIVKAMYDNKGASCCNIKPNSVQREVEYVKMYPMLLAIKKRESPLTWLNATKRGDRWIPYHADGSGFSADRDHGSRAKQTGKHTVAPHKATRTTHASSLAQNKNQAS